MPFSLLNEAYISPVLESLKKAYIKCIDDLLDANGINIPFRHRKLDHYLWHKYRKADESDYSDDE